MTLIFKSLPFVALAFLAFNCKKGASSTSSTASAAATSSTDLSDLKDTLIGIRGLDRCSMRRISDTEAEYVYQNYTVRTLATSNMVGERIIARSKNNEVLELHNTGGNFFNGMRGRFLFVDRGTGPDGREMLVYDVPSQGMTFQSAYTDTSFVASNNKIWIWKPVPESALTKKIECPQQEEWVKNGLKVGYAQRVMFDLSVRGVTTKSEFKCFPMQ